MKTYKKVYPKELKFSQAPSGIRVKYPTTIIKKRSPDIWTIKYLLDKGLYDSRGRNTVTLGKTDTTMALRLHFLPKIFPGVVFRAMNSIGLPPEDIIRNVDKRYKTYEREFTKRGTKKYPESLLETNIGDNLNTCFGAEFPKSRYGVRQFPANIFDGQISGKTRITRKFWIDILTANTSNQLSVLELKARGNASLDLLAQAIDYGVFCHLFKEHIGKCWFPDTDKLYKNKVAIYCIAENFHPALIDDEGIKALIRPNDIMDIIFIQVEVKNDKVESYRVLFDTRKL